MCETYRRREIVTIDGRTSFYKPHISLMNVVGFKVLKVMATNSFNNILQGINDSFDWLDSAGNPLTAVVPAGQYDNISFAIAFDLAVNAVSTLDIFTTTYNVNTKAYSISTNNAITPQWVSGVNTATNLSYIMGYFNNSTGNETVSTGHSSNFPSQLIPPYYLFKSTALSSGRKSGGGGGGTQISITSSNNNITSSPQNYICSLPNQVDGSISTYIYRTNDDNNETYEYNAPRQISSIDFSIIHPYYPDINQSDKFVSIYSPITYEIEFICQKKYK